MTDVQSLPKSDVSVNTPASPLLVTTVISQQVPFVNAKFAIYPCSVKILRPGSHVIPKPGKKGRITSFTWASKRRLRFTAANADPALISHFGLTYHKNCPSSGKIVKIHLNQLLTDLRRKYPGIGYLWILEFHGKEGAHHEGWPHLHVWLTAPVSEDLHVFLAETWNRIVELGDEEHLRVHLHKKNFIPWEMRSAGYLCKYLDKERQKLVPAGFNDVGRFWGTSRGLVKDPSVIGDRQIDDTFSHVSWKPSKQIIRTLCKSQERKYSKKTRWTNYGRRSRGNFTILEGRKIFDQSVNYHQSIPPF